MRRRKTLVLRRDDHTRDSLGMIFLGVIDSPEEIETLVRRYLDATIHILTIEHHDAALRVVIEHTPFEEEAKNLVRLARRLAGSARPRAALQMVTEARHLDSLSVDALKLEARLLASAGEWSRAEERWILAGEISGFDGQMLRGLAEAALEGGRHASGVRYLREAVAVDPADKEAREVLDQLLRQADLQFAEESKRRNEAPK